MLITHTSPDWDAIGFLWLMRRYDPRCADMPILFVNTGSPDRALLDSAYAVGDTGRIYDPSTLRFDHHQLPGIESVRTCATLQTFDHFLETGIAEGAIYALIKLIYAGDCGFPAADQSRVTGIHALLKAQKRKCLDDHALAAWGFEILDDLADQLLGYEQAAREIDQYVVYCSKDAKVVALKGAPHDAVDVAFDIGAHLVLFQSETDSGSYSRGVVRARESSVHTGELIDAAQQASDQPTVRHELSTWYRHESGFFSGRGTSRAPIYTPMKVSIKTIARLVDRVYER